jgi:hypothetical protein
VIPEYHADPLPEQCYLGVHEIKFASLFLNVTFQDCHAKLHFMNGAIRDYNNNADSSGSKKVNIFRDHEFIVGCALMIGAGVYSEHGCNLW